jgi:hypothetical protein
MFCTTSFLAFRVSSLILSSKLLFKCSISLSTACATFDLIESTSACAPPIISTASFFAS